MSITNDTGATAMHGNLFGGLLNFAMGQYNAKQQFERQKQMQERAFQMNEQAVENQARLMKTGMEQAGLNPASVNGAGAPSMAAPSVGMATGQLQQVFTGLTELVNAIKAPSEVDLNKSGAEVNRATASETIPAQAKNLIENANKTIAETKGIKNNVEWLEAQDKFLKSQAPAIVEHRIGQLKASGQWDNLPPATKETLENWAEGHFKTQIGIGEMEGLNKVIDTQTKLSTADREVLNNTRDMIIAFKQISDNKVIDAFAKMPINQQNLMRSQITEYYAQAKNAKSQEDLNKLNEWLSKYTNDQWLIEHGMTDEVERKKYTELLNQFLHAPETFIHGFAEGIPMGMRGLGGKAMEGGFNYFK